MNHKGTEATKRPPRVPDLGSEKPHMAMDDLAQVCAQAHQLMAKGEYEEAMPYVQRALELDPNYAPGYCHLGQVFYCRMMWDQAEVNFKKALALDFGLQEAHYNLALLYQRQRRFREALPFFKQVVLINPNDWESFLRMGQCTAELGNLTDAEAFYVEALRLKPGLLEAAGGLAQIYLRTEQHHKAIEVLKDALTWHPECVELRAALAFAYEQEGDYEQALAQFHQLVTDNPHDAQFFYHLGRCCLELDLLREAEPFLAKAVQLDPQSLEPIQILGELYIRMDKVTEATIVLEHWLHLAGSFLTGGIPVASEQRARVLRLLAECHARLSDHERAKSLLQQSSEAEGNQAAAPAGATRR